MSDASDCPTLEELVADTPTLDVRIGVRQNGAWVDRSRGVNESVDGFLVDATPTGQTRYWMTLSEAGPAVREWTRFTLPRTGRLGGGRTDTGDVTFVVDLITDDGAPPAQPPWSDHREMAISSEAVQRDSQFGYPRADRVAGLDSERDRLEQFLTQSDANWGLSEPTGMLLEGPPGTGKTELVMEVCRTQYGSIPVTVSGPEILNKWVGESERVLREKFDEARETDHKTLYIDELDAIARSRGEISETHNAQIVAQLLVLLDGVEAKQQAADHDAPLKVIASTNMARVVDPALRRPGRLGDRPITFSRPDRAERRAICHHYLENVYASSDGQVGGDIEAFVTGRDLTVLDDLVMATDGATGADLEDLIQLVVRELRTGTDDSLTREHIRKVHQQSFNDDHRFEEQSVTANEEHRPVAGLSARPEQSHPGLAVLTDEAPEDVAAAHFARVGESLPGAVTEYSLRTVDPSDLLSGDRARIEQAFDHRESQRIALYLRRFDQVVAARDQSSFIQQLISVVVEEWLSWEAGNLLLVPEGGAAVLPSG